MNAKASNRIQVLEQRLAAVPDLPPPPEKSLADKLHEIEEGIEELETRRVQFESDPKASEFDRVRFTLTKDRLRRQLERIAKEVRGD